MTSAGQVSDRLGQGGIADGRTRAPAANLLGMRFRRYGAWIVAVTVLAGAQVATARDHDANAIRLTRGKAVFIDGPHIVRASGRTCGSPNCHAYRLDIAPGGWRLRIGIDHVDHHDEFALQLLDPSGSEVAYAGHGYLETSEILYPGPQPGTWTLNVIANNVTDSSYELRAKLEMDPPAITSNVETLPNLRPEPGFDFAFDTPAGSNYSATGTPRISCHPDEMAEDVVVRCLRFSFGYQNAGDGPLDLRFEVLSDPATIGAEVRQRIYRGDRTVFNYDDNKYRERPAGTATYHKIHGHYHYDAVFQAQVFKVDDLEEGRVTRIGEAAKRGACAHDYVLVDFHRFYQDMAGTADSGSDCNFLFTNPTSTRMRIGLSRGWADIYTAELSDNYADFGLNPDGLYLVRVWADPDDHIAETNERDNLAYSLIRIEGDRVRLLERGTGAGPWDKRSKVIRGLG
jgi:hypothetical protein